MLRAELAAVLRLPLDRIRGSLRDLGLDSIMANELRARVPGLPSTQMLTSGITVEALAGEPEAVVVQHAASARRVIDRLVPVDSPKGRLICFPFAGVGSSFFRGWELGDGVEIGSIQYRGRGSRIAEPAFHRMEPLVRELADEIVPLMDRPVAFFGHCMGALVAFLCAHELRRRGFAPQHLFLSACPPPDVYRMPFWDPATGRFMNVEREGRFAIHDLPTDAFLDVLRFLDFPPARTLLRDTTLLPQVLPTVRADFETCATFRWTNETPLDVPISAFSGAEDPFFDRELDAALVGADIGGWRRQTRGPFQSFTRPGDHYFVVPEREFVLKTIREALSWI
jgi:surfactin synthase thioesterase subunit